MDRISSGTGKLLIGVVGFIFLALLVSCNTFGDVQVGYNGVEECASQLTGRVVKEGWWPKAPWCTFDTISIGNNQYEVKDAQAVSKDNQLVHTSVDVTWTYNAANLPEIQRVYRGSAENVILQPNVQQAIRQATANYSAVELTTKRGEVQQHMEDILTGRLTKYHGDINIIQLSLTNYTFSDAWQNAVENKVIATQTLQQEQTVLQTEKVKAQEAIVAANAAAKAQAAQRQTLTPLIIQQQWINKWKGNLPTVMSGGGGVMLDLGNPFTNPSEDKQR